MARTSVKSCIAVCFFLLFETAKSLPIRSSNLETTGGTYSNVHREIPIDTINAFTTEVKNEPANEIPVNGTIYSKNGLDMRNNVRPGQVVTSYDITLRRNGANIEGIATINVQLTPETNSTPLFFNMLEITVTKVQVGVLTVVTAVPTNYTLINQGLEVRPTQRATNYVVIVEYTIPLRTNGLGLYLGRYNDTDYVAMNLHPTNARRVFPCMDEPNLLSSTEFTFENMGYNNLISNSRLKPNSATSFQPLRGPTHLWGMMAHNFVTLAQSNQNFILYARPRVTNQEAQAAVAISNFYNALNNLTGRLYREIIPNQDGNMHVMALPDVSRDWYALSTVCVWEPYILMETTASVTQRKEVLLNIAEAMSKQWFGYVLYPENWRFQWVISGLNRYVAYDITKTFQTDPEGVDVSLIDVDAIFTTDVIQESLLLDSYSSAQPIESAANIFVENAARVHMHGLLNYKAPALMRMLRLILGNDNTDVVKLAARALLTANELPPANSQLFYDAIASVRPDNLLVPNVDVFMRTWTTNVGYPVLTVGFRNGGVVLTQQRFSFSTIPQLNFVIPITFTTSVEPNFDNLRPTSTMAAATTILDMELEEEDWVLMNLQGQGYYRVNYDEELWERIIMALEDPERREEIHPLNRASLIDDSLNLARAGRLDYDTAFRVVLTMEQETEYAVWRSFIRNMDFLRKRLVPFVNVNEDRDDDIYLRMIRRTIAMFEEEIGFEPEGAMEPAMQSLTRSIVMDHACRSGYDACIATAVDLFYDPNNPDDVNPNIPRDIRPAVYCTMVREGEEDVREALEARMELEASKYERLVILEALACSQDRVFIEEYLAQTIAANSPYVTEERKKIFEAVASSSFQNTRLALTFISRHTNDIRNMYGGPDKLEDVIFTLADNIVTTQLATEFNVWVNSLDSISNLRDSSVAAVKARNMITENMAWNTKHLQEVYDWIDLNHAPTVFVSTLLIILSLFITLFNH